MAFVQKPNSGSMFPNNRKTSDTHPDWTGTLNIEGKEYWFNAWEKKSAKGNFFSFTVKPKDAPAVQSRSAPPARAPQPAREKSDFDRKMEVTDDDIPW